MRFHDGIYLNIGLTKPNKQFIIRVRAWLSGVTASALPSLPPNDPLRYVEADQRLIAWVTIKRMLEIALKRVTTPAKSRFFFMIERTFLGGDL